MTEHAKYARTNLWPCQNSATAMRTNRTLRQIALDQPRMPVAKPRTKASRAASLCVGGTVLYARRPQGCNRAVSVPQPAASAFGGSGNSVTKRSASARSPSTDKAPDAASARNGWPP
jgi:hypothetical protein